MEDFIWNESKLDTKTQREKQELSKIVGKSHKHLFPVKNSCNKSVGEYPVPIEAKINLAKFLSENESLNKNDRIYLQNRVLPYIPEYEKKGFLIGLFTGGLFFFFPAIRRLPFTLRFGVSLIPVIYWANWGYGYGRDLVLIRSINLNNIL